jgi:hypothetical protein
MRPIIDENLSLRRAPPGPVVVTGHHRKAGWCFDAFGPPHSIDARAKRRRTTLYPASPSAPKLHGTRTLDPLAAEPLHPYLRQQAPRRRAERDCPKRRPDPLQCGR